MTDQESNLGEQRHMSTQGIWRRARPVALLFVLVLAAITPVAAQQHVFVDPEVERGFSESGETTFLVLLRKKADLSQAFEIEDWETRGRFVTERLRQVADSSQVGLRELLTAWGTEFEPYWIVNSILVTSHDPVLLSLLAARPEVAEIRAPVRAEIPPSEPGERLPAVESIEWNIDQIGAPLLWADGVTGEGIVVANIDSGVGYTHPALVNQYRGNLGDGTFDHNYNWFDARGVGCPTAPCDSLDNPHGTSTMGVIVGDDGGANQIGVAPGARWIAANGIPHGASVLAATEWMLAPTDLNGQNPNPDLRPHVLNNSWGAANPTQVFRDIVLAWVAAGIFPVFAAMNEGPACMTTLDPGNYPESYAVGAHSIANVLANFSGRGPSSSGPIKPDNVAPGVDVRTSVTLDFHPSGYLARNGTSFATPHVAGAVALLWSGRPELIGEVEATRELLDRSAIDVSDSSCGGTPGDNNAWGEGRLDVPALFYGTIFGDGFESGDTSAWSSTLP